MATTLVGFVTQVFAGRAGLVTATILPLSNPTPVVVQVSDIDGEPERFNERLTKVRLIRDAMDRAEPIVVVHEPNKKAGGNEVVSVKRIGRDHVRTGTVESEFEGFVATLRIREVHGTESSELEATDVAEVGLVNPTTGASGELTLALQRPERGTTGAMLRFLEAAKQAGDAVTVRAISGAEGALGHWIVAVGGAKLGGDTIPVDGFVESIGVGGILGIPFARVEITTAPGFPGSGAMVDPGFFHPSRVKFLVPEGSRMLTNLRDSLRGGLRVRVGVQGIKGKESGKDNAGSDDHNGLLARREADAVYSETGETAAPRANNLNAFLAVSSSLASSTLAPFSGKVLMALHVEVLAPLASAVRPVWVRVRKESLDAPPEAECVLPMPATDFSPAGVASLQVPHRAAWEGTGCFNHGVYRIQIVAPVEPRVRVNGVVVGCMMMVPGPQAAGELEYSEGGLQEMTSPAVGVAKPIKDLSPRGLVGSDLKGAKDIKTATVTYHVHACLHDLNTIRVEFDEWRCKYPFHLDVFKVV